MQRKRGALTARSRWLRSGGGGAVAVAAQWQWRRNSSRLGGGDTGMACRATGHKKPETALQRTEGACDEASHQQGLATSLQSHYPEWRHVMRPAESASLRLARASSLTRDARAFALRACACRSSISWMSVE
eukprot:6201514-Pleurochrysis_carterae.AAC.1